jgi:hypothetical protein
MRLLAQILLAGDVFFTVLVDTSAACPRHHPAVTSCQFIFETAPYRSSHASTLVAGKRGLLAAWYGGTAEKLLHPPRAAVEARHRMASNAISALRTFETG